jgi:hypothetical protein
MESTALSWAMASMMTSGEWFVVRVIVSDETLAAVAILCPSSAKFPQPLLQVNPATSVMAEFIVTEAGLLEPVYDPVPVPDQLEKVYPLLADALT